MGWGLKLNRVPRATLIFSAALFTFPNVVMAADPITEEEAHSIGVDAYLYF
jgi:hypothetical protein